MLLGCEIGSVFTEACNNKCSETDGVTRPRMICFAPSGLLNQRRTQIQGHCECHITDITENKIWISDAYNLLTSNEPRRRHSFKHTSKFSGTQVWRKVATVW